MSGKPARESDEIIIDRDGHVVTVTLNRPSKKNAVTGKMWQAIGDYFAAVDEDGAARAVILRGAGKDFSAGADISEFEGSRGDAVSAKIYEENNSRAFASIRDCPVPVIAAIRGVCFGGGFGIAAACDIRIASHEAVFSVPAAKLGLAYPQDAMIDIVSSCGAQTARYLAYSGARISSEKALATGFLLAVHGFEELDSAAMSLAATIAENAPLSIMASKAAIGAAVTGSHQKADIANRLGAATFDSEDYAEGRAAFREKRPPRFRGR